jgi:hypothetical protein
LNCCLGSDSQSAHTPKQKGTEERTSMGSTLIVALNSVHGEYCASNANSTSNETCLHSACIPPRVLDLQQQQQQQQQQLI